MRKSAIGSMPDVAPPEWAITETYPVIALDLTNTFVEMTGRERPEVDVGNYYRE